MTADNSSSVRQTGFDMQGSLGGKGAQRVGWRVTLMEPQAPVVAGAFLLIPQNRENRGRGA